MSRNYAMFIPVFLIISLGFLSSSCSAQSTTNVVYAGYTSTCTSAWDIGQSIFCCDGACIDGTSDESPNGICKYWTDGCNDPLTPPVCASDQVFLNDNFNGVDAGIGNCYYWCTWQQLNYTWNCCDCPPGYTAVANTCAEYILPNSNQCMGCPQGYALIPNLASSGGYFCSDESLQSVLCDLGNDVKNALDAAGRVGNFVGTVCPTRNLAGVGEGVLQALYAWMQTLLNPSDTGAQFDLAVTVVGTIKSFALGAAIVAGAAATGVDAAILLAGAEIWLAACDLNGLIGLAVSALSGFDALLLQKCPSTSSKRSISGEAWDEAILASDNILSPRDDTYNPCAEFVSLFPADYSSMADFDAACNQLQYDDPSGVNDTNIADSMVTMQELCANWWNSGMGDFMIGFANVLGAVEAAVPYCDAPVTSTSTWSAAASSTGSSSYASASQSTDQSAAASTGSSVSNSVTLSSTSSQSSSSTSTQSTSLSLSTSSTSSTTSTTSSSLSSSSSSPVVSASSSQSSSSTSTKSTSLPLSTSSTKSLSSSSSSSVVSASSSSRSSTATSISSTTSKIVSSSSKLPSSTSSSAGSSSKGSTSSQKSTTSSGSTKTTSSFLVHSTSSQTSSKSSSSTSSRTSSSSLVHTTSSSISKTSSSSHTTSQSSSSTTKSSSISHSIPTLSTSTRSVVSSTSTSTSTWNPIGCYTDNLLGLGRTLTKRESITGGSAQMTVQACQVACREAGYIYTGLEYSRECWCGNAFANGGVYLGPDGTNGCTDSCAGDKVEICGGSKRLSVYFWS